MLSARKSPPLGFAASAPFDKGVNPFLRRPAASAIPGNRRRTLLHQGNRVRLQCHLHPGTRA
jgi:hypothetical protein